MLKELRKALGDADDEIRAGIVRVEAQLKELALGIPLSVKVPFEGTLHYRKVHNKWCLEFDNSEFSHAETIVPLLNCSSDIRVKAAVCLPKLLEQAETAVSQALAERKDALYCINKACKVAGGTPAASVTCTPCNKDVDFGGSTLDCDLPKDHTGPCGNGGFEGGTPDSEEERMEGTPFRGQCRKFMPNLNRNCHREDGHEGPCVAEVGGRCDKTIACGGLKICRLGRGHTGPCDEEA